MSYVLDIFDWFDKVGEDPQDLRGNSFKTKNFFVAVYSSSVEVCLRDETLNVIAVGEFFKYVDDSGLVCVNAMMNALLETMLKDIETLTEKAIRVQGELRDLFWETGCFKD